MFSRIAIALIRFYQKFISPRKGFCCASRALHGGPSCSEFTRLAIEQQGLFSALHDIRGQFGRCTMAAEEIRRRREEKKKKKKKDDGSADCCLEAGCETCDCVGSLKRPKSCGGASKGDGVIDGCDFFDACSCNPFS